MINSLFLRHTVIYFLLLFYANNTFAQDNNNTFNITGKTSNVDNNKNYYAYLVYMGNDANTIIDSSKIHNNIFKLTNKLSLPTIAAFTIAEKDKFNDQIAKGNKTNIFLYKGNYNINIDNISLINQSKISNNQLQSDYENYLKTTENATDETVIIDKTTKFITSKKNSVVSLAILNFLTQNKIITSDKASKLFDNLSENIKKTDFGIETNNEIKKLKNIEASDPVAIGNTAPDFELPSLDGNKISLSSFKGKWVLIDFWASWCGPCRAENPNLVKAYEKFKNSNFIILGVSLDEKEEKWKRTIISDKLTWPQVSDLKGWRNAAAVKYNINAIPANFLVSPEGKIVATNLRGKNLHTILNKFLNK